MGDTLDVDVVGLPGGGGAGDQINTPKLDLEDKESIGAWMFEVQDGVTSFRMAEAAIVE
jgi:hypothetical protein